MIQLLTIHLQNAVGTNDIDHDLSDLFGDSLYRQLMEGTEDGNIPFPSSQDVCNTAPLNFPVQSEHLLASTVPENNQDSSVILPPVVQLTPVEVKPNHSMSIPTSDNHTQIICTNQLAYSFAAIKYRINLQSRRCVE